MNFNDAMRANSIVMAAILPCQRQIVRLMMSMMIVLFCLLSIEMALADESVATGNKARDYRIGPEDVLQISVWKEPELEREVLVRPDGGISFPLAGDVTAAGMTPAELQVEITSRIQKYVPDAVVTVSVTKLSGFRVYVIGKVKKPGQIVIGRYVDVLQALTLAGGLDPYADQKEIKVIRKQDGKEIVFPFNYKAVKNGENLQQNINLQNDDVVIVP